MLHEQPICNCNNAPFDHFPLNLFYKRHMTCPRLIRLFSLYLLTGSIPIHRLISLRLLHLSINLPCRKEKGVLALHYEPTPVTAYLIRLHQNQRYEIRVSKNNSEQLYQFRTLRLIIPTSPVCVHDSSLFCSQNAALRTLMMNPMTQHGKWPRR